MTQEDKELLLKDLCARLPYGVVLDVDTTDWRAPQGHIKVKIEGIGILSKDMSLIVNCCYYGDKYKPYLRPMSSMNEEERKIYAKLLFADLGGVLEDYYKSLDYLNSIHIDYRGLIPKGLAIKITKENNPYI